MSRPGSRGSLLALLVVGSACATGMPPPAVGDPPAPVSDTEVDQAYQRAYDRWTRRAELYNGLDSRLFAAASFQSSELRAARIARLAAFRALPSEEVGALYAKEQKAHAERYEFLLGVHAVDRTFDDFSRKDSIWRIALVSDAGEIEPLSVQRVTKPDANMRALYPFLRHFWTAYVVCFPRQFPNGARVLPQTGGQFSLRLASSVGRLDLVYSLPVTAAEATETPDTWP